MAGRKFKTIKHYHQPGDLHEPTFSCYRQIKLLTNDAWRGFLSRAIDDAGEKFRMPLVAFVFMPEHVHLLVFPLEEKPAIDLYLAAVKRPVSASVKFDLAQAGSPLPGCSTFRKRSRIRRCWRSTIDWPSQSRCPRMARSPEPQS
jgi:putative transposase